MDLSTAIRMRINNLIIERNINVSKLSTLAGISCSTLSKFLSGKRKIIRLDMIEYICEGLDIKLKDFFDDEIEKYRNERLEKRKKYKRIIPILLPFFITRVLFEAYPLLRYS